MADHILSKGFLASGSSAFTAGEVVVVGTNRTVTRATTAGQGGLIGVAKENVDATKVTEGNVVLGVDLIGISRVIAGAAISVGAKVTNDTNAHVVAATAAAAFPVKQYLGIAVTPATAAGDIIDVLLTPGATE